MRRIISIMLVICVGLMFFPEVKAEAAGERVVYSFEQIDEHSGRVILYFRDNTVSGNIQITGWRFTAEKEITVSYRTGINVPEGYNSMLLSSEDFSYPMKIFLQEGNLQTVKLIDLTEGEEQRHILHLYDRGIIDGYLDKTYKPEQAITRGEVAKLITAACQYTLTDKSISGFLDIDNYWGKQWIETLSAKKILLGYEDNTFKPNNNIKISEIMTIIDKTFEIGLSEKKVFEQPKATHWSNSYYISLQKKGLVLAEDEFTTVYNPEKPATRAEVAVLISRALENLHTIR